MEVSLENSSSKTGKHAIRSLIFAIEGNNIKEFKEYKILKKEKGTYNKGEKLVISIPDKGTFVHLIFVKNIYNKVKGKVYVYKDGKVVLELNYRKLKLKAVRGDTTYAEYVKSVFEMLKIPLKRVNLKIGG
jgi:hypothetical protein